MTKQKKSPHFNRKEKAVGNRNRRNQHSHPAARAPSGQPGKLLLYGLHTVGAALMNNKRAKKILHATESAVRKIDENALRKSAVEVRLYEARALDKMVGADAVHQGVVLECLPLEGIDASELFQLADAKLLLMLDQITDPHNVGAILRTAVAFGVEAVIITRRNSATETAVLAKSASGALDMIDVVEVRNLSKTLEELNQMRFITIGLDSEGPSVLEETLDAEPNRPVVLVLGSEGQGLRQKTRETCTHLARLDMPGKIKSLNVSNAAALSLYIASSKISR